MRRLAPFLAVLVLAGCGGSSGSVKPAPSATLTMLSPRAALRVANANLALARYCVAITGTGNATSRQADAAFYGVERLIVIARKHPTAILDLHSRRTMRQVLSDSASVVDVCDPGLARQLERAIATLG